MYDDFLQGFSFDKPTQNMKKLFIAFKLILESVGAYKNDDIDFYTGTENNRLFLFYKDYLGIHKQCIELDSPVQFFEDGMSLLFAHCKELNTSLETINENTGGTYEGA